MFSLLLALIYVCFISLGLPDSLLGAVWPTLYVDMNVPMSYAGIISTVISVFTILSSLLSDTMSKKLGAGPLTAVSVLMTAVGMFGFGLSKKFWMVIAWSIPYGLGAGGVDAVLNNYVALHFKARHMSWLHCSWGVGASVSPYIMSFALTHLGSWSSGYFSVSLLQMALSLVVFLSLPLWKKREAVAMADGEETRTEPIQLKEIFSIRGALPSFFAFFAYCSLELSTSLWASSYLVKQRGVNEETAAALASMFYIGITLGCVVNGFLTMRFGDRALVRTGFGIVAAGILLVFLPFHNVLPMVGFVVIGLGCAPIYPCILHMTPDIFGREYSQAMIGFQMAFANAGFCIAPPLFGVIAERVSIGLLPFYLVGLLAVMVLMYELMVARAAKRRVAG